MTYLRNSAVSKIARVLAIAITATTLVVFPAGLTQVAVATGGVCDGLTGSGTEQSPVLISTSAEVMSISACVQANPGAQFKYLLTNNIDMSDLGHIQPLAAFEGHLDGGPNFFGISNISVSGEFGIPGVGLFSLASGSATVSNISLQGNVETNDSQQVAGLLFGRVDGSLGGFAVWRVNY
jgi:hypothetical protein